MRNNNNAVNSLMGNLLTPDNYSVQSRHSSLLNPIESSIILRSLEKLPKLKFVPSAKDCNSFLQTKQRSLKKVGKIIDPKLQEVI